jgi:hypothetical protein
MMLPTGKLICVRWTFRTATQHHTSSPWLGVWTVLAAATGARNGELCGLEWADLDLNAGTVQFRQTLAVIDPTVLSDDGDGNGGARVGGGRKELAVGPLKSTASTPSSPCHHSPSRRCAITAASSTGSASPSARPYPLAALGRAGPGTPPGRAGPGLPHRAGHPGQPQPRQPRLRPAGRQRRAGRPPAPAAPCSGLGDGRSQGTGKHHRRPAAPRRRRRARPTGVHPPAATDRAPSSWGDRRSVRPRSA